MFNLRGEFHGHYFSAAICSPSEMRVLWAFMSHTSLSVRSDLAKQFQIKYMGVTHVSHSDYSNEVFK